jgi:hypothetical protein
MTLSVREIAPWSKRYRSLLILRTPGATGTASAKNPFAVYEHPDA